MLNVTGGPPACGFWRIVLIWVNNAYKHEVAFRCI